MTEWPPHNGDNTPGPAATLCAAIRGDAHDAFYAAIKQIDNLNQNGGIFLRTAAQARNKLFMKELVSRGADIPYALDVISKEMSQIPRQRAYDEYDDDYIIRYKNKDDERRYKNLSEISTTLQQFQKHYTEHLAAIEVVKNQLRILEEIQALKQEIADLRDGTPLSKGALPPPASMRKPPPPQ